MNHDIVSTERFVSQLRELKPAQPGLDLQMRLEAALREVKLEQSLAQKIVYHPFFQWSAAAAALLTALLVSLESVEQRPGASISQAPAEARSTPDVHQVFQLVNGKLVPSSNGATMLPTSFRGIQVFEGKAYRKFGHGQESYLELIKTAQPD